MTGENHFRERLIQRVSELRNWMDRQEPDCRVEQRHTKDGTCERAYWHFGYLMAIEDMLRLLDSPNYSTSPDTRKSDTE